MQEHLYTAFIYLCWPLLYLNLECPDHPSRTVHLYYIQDNNKFEYVNLQVNLPVLEKIYIGVICLQMNNS